MIKINIYQTIYMGMFLIKRIKRIKRNADTEKTEEKSENEGKQS